MEPRVFGGIRADLAATQDRDERGMLVFADLRNQRRYIVGEAQRRFGMRKKDSNAGVSEGFFQAGTGERFAVLFTSGGALVTLAL